MATLLASVAMFGACGSDDDSAVTDNDAGDEGSSGNPMTNADSAGAGDTSIPTDAAALDSGDSGDASLLSPTFVYRDINHVLSTGQSLSVGATSTAVTLTQPYANTTFVTGVQSGGTGLTSFVPLKETTVETMSSSFASLVTKMARETVLVGQPAGQTSHDLVVSVHGVGGIAYSGLKKGTVAYANGIAQAQAGHDLALAAKKSYVVRAVTNVHGETDSQNNNAAYEANLVEWQNDYQTDVTAITGQTEAIPMFETQFSSWTRLAGMPATNIITNQQLSAHVNNPGKIILVGAKYHLPYFTDGVHLTSDGYKHMGEDYAKVYRHVILEGKTWEPVRPMTITRSGAVVTVKMHVPAPPLVIDTTLVTDPGKNGFEWTDGSASPPTIASVALSGPDTVVITLSATPGANGHLRYAFTGISGALGGPTTGPRGNLRDSDATPSRDGFKLYNWCVHFDMPVP
jgi:hypothetical protein